MASRPTGQATIGAFDDSNLEFVEKEVEPARDGEVRVRNILFSVDPFQRTLMGNTPSEAAVVDAAPAIPTPVAPNSEAAPAVATSEAAPAAAPSASGRPRKPSIAPKRKPAAPAQEPAASGREDLLAPDYAR